MLGQQLIPPFKHFLPEGEVLLLPGEIRRPLILGRILLLEVLLGQGNVAGLVLQLSLPFLDPLHSRSLLGPLLFQNFVHGTQLGTQLCDDLLPLVQGLLPFGQPLLLPARLQLPSVHLLEVLLVFFVVSHEFGPLKGKLLGHRLGALLQLGAPVAEALVLRFQRLPFSPNRRLGLMKSLMGTRQHPGEGNRRCFWLGAGSEPPPKNHLRLLQSGRRVGAGHAPRVTLDGGGGRSWDLLRCCRWCTRRHHRL
jgi:hypothetical protein